MGWLAVLSTLALACAATPDLAYLDGGLLASDGRSSVEGGAELPGADGATGATDGSTNDVTVRGDAGGSNDAFVPADAPVYNDAGVPVCIPDPQANQGCCINGVKCIGVGCVYCQDCASCVGTYCCRAGKGNPAMPFFGTCKQTTMGCP